MSYTAEELYTLYAGWTGKLHAWVRDYLSGRINCEYFPLEYKMALYPGDIREQPMGIGCSVPSLIRPEGARIVLQLPTPDSDPTTKDLDKAFRALCTSAAWVLGISTTQLKLATHGRPKPRKKSKPVLRVRNGQRRPK
jgi:hypothetical protein